MIAPVARPPTNAGPRQPHPPPRHPQRASAVVVVATAVTPKVAAATSAVRAFLMTSPHGLLRASINAALKKGFQLHGKQGLNDPLLIVCDACGSSQRSGQSPKEDT